MVRVWQRDKECPVKNLVTLNVIGATNSEVSCDIVRVVNECKRQGVQVHEYRTYSHELSTLS